MRSSRATPAAAAAAAVGTSTRVSSGVPPNKRFELVEKPDKVLWRASTNGSRFQRQHQLDIGISKKASPTRFIGANKQAIFD